MLNERKLTEREITKRDEALKGLLSNKRKLVKKYGRGAEKVMYGIATKQSKNKVENMNKEKIRELIQSALIKNEVVDDLDERVEKVDKLMDQQEKLKEENFKSYPSFKLLKLYPGVEMYPLGSIFSKEDYGHGYTPNGKNFDTEWKQPYFEKAVKMGYYEIITSNPNNHKSLSERIKSIMQEKLLENTSSNSSEKEWNSIDVSRTAEKGLDSKEWNSRTAKKLAILKSLNSSGKFKKDWDEERLQGWVDQNYPWEKVSKQFKDIK